MVVLSRVVTAILFVLGLLALLLGIKLFNQREEIKGRTLLLESGVIKVAESIEKEASTNLTETGHPTVKIEREQLKRFYLKDEMGAIVKDPQGKPVIKGSNTLDGILTELAGQSAIQLSRLNDTRGVLKNTEERLDQTNAVLTTTAQNLTVATNTIAERDATIVARDDEIRQKKQNIDDLTEQKSRLEQKNEEQQGQIAKLQDAKQDLESKIEADKRYIEKLTKKITDLERGETDEKPAAGLKGRIAVINKEWNFVVIDILPSAKLIANLDLIVQREDKLVGKVHVSEVKQSNHFAIADILPDWQQIPLAVGDYVFF